MQFPLSRRHFLRTSAAAGAALLIPRRGRAAGGRFVEAALKAGQPWQPFDTRTLEDLPELPVDGPLDPFDGLTARTGKKTGFFHPEKIDGRWWLVTPAGGLFINRGVVSVRRIQTPGAKEALKKRFGDEAAWAAQTSEMLAGKGFNGVGSWSENELLEAVQPRRLATTKMWSFMSTFGKSLGLTYQQPGHTGYRGDAIPVFEPGWEPFCDKYAKALAAMQDDPWLIGHYSDNELPFSREALRAFLALEPGTFRRQGHVRVPQETARRLGGRQRHQRTGRAGFPGAGGGELLPARGRGHPQARPQPPFPGFALPFPEDRHAGLPGSLPRLQPRPPLRLPN